MKKYGIIYFSGTGNTRLLAKHLAVCLGCESHSIEEELDFKGYIESCNRMVIMYPIHYSTPPMFMREFLDELSDSFENKEIISIATQMFFSGDGARVVEDFLPESIKLIDTHHVNMPNNIPNISFVPVTTDIGNRHKVKRGLRKIERIAHLIKNEDFRLKHTSEGSIKIGMSQRKGSLKSEKDKKSRVWVGDECIKCGLCAKICPTNNYIIEEKAIPQGDCIFCMRCENKCPTRAIRVLINKPVKRVYKGPIAK